MSDYAQTLLSVARQHSDHGRELPPHVVHELAAICLDARLSDSIRAEAQALLEIEAGAQ